MAKEVDIWWESRGKRLKASLRWTNKRGRISFFLIPASHAKCDRCPFKGNPVCGKWKAEKPPYPEIPLCSLLWRLPGDNKFERRGSFSGWQPLGPVGREKKNKKKDK